MQLLSRFPRCSEGSGVQSLVMSGVGLTLIVVSLVRLHSHGLERLGHVGLSAILSA